MLEELKNDIVLPNKLSNFNFDFSLYKSNSKILYLRTKKKIGIAVIRNKVKRRFRIIFNYLLKKYKTYKIIIYIKKNISYKEIILILKNLILS